MGYGKQLILPFLIEPGQSVNSNVIYQWGVTAGIMLLGSPSFHGVGIIYHHVPLCLVT